MRKSILDLAPPPGYSFLSPARQIGTPLRPAPLPLTWRLRQPLRWNSARRGGGDLVVPTKEVFPEGPNGSLPPAGGSRWGLSDAGTRERRRPPTAAQFLIPNFGRSPASPAKTVPTKGPNESLPPARGPRWCLDGQGQAFFTKRNGCFFSWAPAAAPRGERTLFWGPRYKLSCVSVPRRTPPGHRPGAFTSK